MTKGVNQVIHGDTPGNEAFIPADERPYLPSANEIGAMDDTSMKLSPPFGFPMPESELNGTGILSEGSRFRAYVVGPCIGHGGMARIYRAEHEGLQRQVALKVLTEGVARDAESRRRFLREARIAAAIKHPNVVNIFDVGVHQGVPYLVMELLEGQDLESLLRSQGSLDEQTIVHLIVPIVAGLAAVHDAGIVHRDLKPGNVFLARGRNNELEPKVLDFGISKSMGIDHMKLTFAKGRFLGTPFYVAPEALSGHEGTALSDQYSLGVLMYECATGINPFEAKTVMEVLRLITAGQYVPPAQRKPALSRRMTAIIERCMSLNPADRFPNLRQLGRELLLLSGQRTRITWALSFGIEAETAANARITGSMPPGGVSASTAPTGRQSLTPPTRRALAAGGTIAFAMAALGAMWWFRGSAQLETRANSLSPAVEAPAKAVAVAPAAPTPAEAESAPSLLPKVPEATPGNQADTVERKPQELASKASGKQRPGRAPKRGTGQSDPSRRQVRRAAAPAALQPTPMAASPALAREPDLDVGTNGAPILD